jgi:ketosteroid isomerase-like protein
MSYRKLTLQTPDEAEAVFYEAFQRCDSEVMAALWADGDVVCVHPGSDAIIGHVQIARSFVHIFTGAQRPSIQFSVEKRMASADLAVHLVTEDIATGPGTAARVLATNVYRKDAQGWLMVAHHASVVQARSQAQTVQ